MQAPTQPRRTAGFRSPEGSGEFLTAINELVSSGESHWQEPEPSALPVVLVVGAPRSGTTVLMQWLKAVGLAVPSNLAARFSMNPRFAGMLQRLLSDPALGYRDELAISAPDDGFSSTYGKTRGVLAPHEFSFFFRRFFPVTVGEELSPEQLAACDTAGFLAGLRRFSGPLQAPAAVKAFLIQYHLGLFHHDPAVIIIHTVRHEPDNVISLLRHRRLVAEDVNEWISVRPPEYAWLRELPPAEQVAGQVHFTNLHIGQQLDGFPQERFIRLDHGDFCRHPAALHEALRARLAAAGCAWDKAYEGPESFTTRHYDPASAEYEETTAALDRVRRMAEDRGLLPL
jgi:hypothetical protein